MSIRLLILLAISSPVIAQDQYNYDESKIPTYTLPDPLLKLDGTKVTTAAQWPARRAEILAPFEDHVYGSTPKAAANTKLTAKVTLTIPDFLDGKATLREVALSFEDHTINLLLVTPNASDKPAPAFLGLNFKGNHTIHPDPRISLPSAWVRNDRKGKGPVTHNKASTESRGIAATRWPLELIIDQGFALATIYYGDIDPDFDDGFQNGVHATFGKPGKDEWGSIGTWTWGLSRGLDFLIQDSKVDGSKVVVIGHSRLGKTSLWAGATDPRFALTISNDSGCGGAALSRRAIGETVKRINTSFPHWFSDSFQQYNGNESALPVDQHMLVALLAPRPVYIGSAEDDPWADPNGEFLSGKHAGPVYALFDKKGLGVDKQPEVDTPVGHTIGYHIRKGKHDVTTYDWTQYLQFAKRHLR